MHSSTHTNPVPRRTFFRTTALVLMAGLISFSTILTSSAEASSISTGESIAHQTLQSKYTYFKKNNSVVITAILETRCTLNHKGFSYKWREGAEIWVSQTKAYDQNGLSMYPTIAYRKAPSIKSAFSLTPAGETQLWWTKKWGCPVIGSWNTYGTKVTMTTQQLIDAGY